MAARDRRRARCARAGWRQLKLESFVKTTGGKGLHVVFPLTPQADWDTVKAFAQSIASAMAADRPDRYTDNMAKSGRRGRIFVDYLRNGMRRHRHRRLLDARARRARRCRCRWPGTSSGENIRSNHFTLLNLPKRLAFLDHDPWEGLASIKQTLPGAAANAPSKAELAAYWKKVSKQALAHLARRPLKLVGPQLAKPPKAVRKLGDERFWIDSVDGLLGLVEMGAVELLAANVTIDDLERPDMLVLSVTAADTALRLRTLLQAEGLESWPKLTGGRELHVMVPIEPDLNAAEALRYSEQLAGRLAKRQHRLPLQQAGGRGDRRLLAARPARLPDRRAGGMVATAARPRAGRLHHEEASLTHSGEWWCSNSESATRQPSA